MPDWEPQGLSRPQILAQRSIYRGMEKVAAWVRSYRESTGRCPEETGDIAALMRELSETMDDDPYTAEQDHMRVRLVFDHSLTDHLANHYRSNPPSSWSAPPGTITLMVSHGGGIFAVWAAGMDGRPMRHEVSNKLLLLTGRCH